MFEERGQFHQVLLNGLSVLLGAVFLMIPAWLNGYPFLYPDTGTYLWSGFQRELLIGRPMAYGLFLAQLSAKTSLWYALFAQCLIISWVIFQAVSLFIGKTWRWAFHPALIIVLSCSTGFALISAQLLPDAFTALICLLLLVLLFGEQGPIHRAMSTVLFVFMLLTHNSHVMIVLLTLGGVLAIKLVTGTKLLHWSRIAASGALTLGTLAFTPVFHGLVGGEFALSKGEHVFLLNRTREAGVLQQFLADECPRKDYALCAYQDLLEGDFMWDMGRSPLYKLGGWENTEVEFNRILSDMLSRGKYLVPLVQDIAASWLHQVITWDFEDMGHLGENSGPYHPIHTYLPQDAEAMSNAHQGQGPLSFPILHKIANTLIGLSLVWVFLLLVLRKTKPQFRLWLAVVLIFIVANAVVCSTFSLAIGRYQARVIWLVVFMSLCLAGHWSLYLRKRPEDPC